MLVDRQMRRQTSRLEQAAQSLDEMLVGLSRQQSINVSALAEARTALADHGFAPLPPPPTGQRYVTLAEMQAEYATATAARRQALLAIRCELLPRETVVVPVGP